MAVSGTAATVDDRAGFNDENADDGVDVDGEEGDESADVDSEEVEVDDSAAAVIESELVGTEVMAVEDVVITTAAAEAVCNSLALEAATEDASATTGTDETAFAKTDSTWDEETALLVPIVGEVEVEGKLEVEDGGGAGAGGGSVALVPTCFAACEVVEVVN
jgi:hypothetical protein